RERELRTAVRIYKDGLKLAKDTKLERYFHYRLGIVLADLQRTKEASVELKKAQALAKEAELKVAILEELGRVYAQTGRRKEAARAWREILIVRRNDYFATTHVATLLAKEKMFKEVDEVFNNAINTYFKNDPAATLKLRARQGEIFESSHRYKEAAKAYQEVLSRTRAGNWLRKQVKARLRRMYFQLGQAYALIDFYKKQLKERPDDPEPLLDLADAYEVMGSKSLARRLLLDERKNFPSNIAIRERLLHLLGGPMLYKRQSSVLPLSEPKDEEDPDEDPEEDEDEDKEKDSKKEKKTKESELDSSLEMNLEDLFFEAAEWSKPRILVLKELIALRPKESKYYQALATEYLKLEDEESANAILAQLQKLIGGIEGLLQAATAYKESEQFEKAIETLKKAAKASPGDERPELALADIYLMLRKKKSALKALARAAGAPNGQASSLGAYGQRRLATLLEERKLLLEAARAMERAVKGDDEITSRQDLIKIGRLFQRAEMPITAGKWFFKALEVSTNQTDRENVLTTLRENLTEPKNLEWLSTVLSDRIDKPKTAAPDIVKTLADVYIDLNRHVDAIELLEEAAGGPPPLGYAARYAAGEKTAEVPKTALGEKLPPRVYYLRALVPLYSGAKGNKGDVLKAFSALRELSRLDPGHRWRYALAEGIAQNRRKHNKEALKIFKMVLAAAPANAPVFSDLARRFGELGDKKAALEAAQKAVIQEPRDGRRHWLAIELIRRHLKREAQELELLKTYRRFVQSGVNSSDLEQARDDLYELLLKRSEKLAARHKFVEAAACAAESRNLASNAESRARSQLLGAVLKLDSPDALNALEILQGGIGRYRKEWVIVGDAKVRASLLASAWLQRISGKAYEIYQSELAPRGQELLEVAMKQKDKDLLNRLSRLFPFAPQARQTNLKRVQKLVKRKHFEEALWLLDSINQTKPREGADPLASVLKKLEDQCRNALGETTQSPPKQLETRPRRSFRTRYGTTNTRVKKIVRDVDPVLYGQRLFFAQGKNHLIAVHLKRLFKRGSGERQSKMSAARFEIGKLTPASSIVYNLKRPSNYYYYNGTLGVASYPQSLTPQKQQMTSDPDIVWKRKVTGLTVIKAMGGRLFVASNSVQAISPRTGHALWKYGDNQESTSQAAQSTKTVSVLALEVSQERVFALFSNGECVALNPLTGECLWQASDLGQFGLARLQLVKGKQDRLLIARGDQVFALLAESGKRLWIGANITAAASSKNETRKTKKGTKTALKASPQTKKGRSYSSYSSGPVRYSGANAATLYKVPPAGTPRVNLQYNYGTGSRYGSQPTIDPEAPELWISDNVVVLHNHKGSVVAYDLATGKVMAARFYAGSPFVSVYSKKLYVVLGNGFQVVDLDQDKLLHEVVLKQKPAGPAHIVDKQVLIPGIDEFVCVAPKSGEVIYQESFNSLSELGATKKKSSSSTTSGSYSSRRYGGSNTNAPQYTGAMKLDTLGSWIAARGKQFLVLDPDTGKRVFQYKLAAPQSDQNGKPMLDGKILVNPWGLVLVDNDGVIHVFAAKGKSPKKPK
ncbi:MAG: PQQ-binding-like beta-propeller repeat protein, partial [Planctomycetota bacterium]|nr:PQQ-binding-like beta-propeller repeat protein [Planctomycetota bacterium]